MNLLNIRLSKTQLDTFSSLIGAGIFIVGAAVQYEFLPVKEGGFVGAILTAILGILTNRPATASPTTAQVERKNIQEG